jgi:hypothetical protein
MKSPTCPQCGAATAETDDRCPTCGQVIAEGDEPATGVEPEGTIQVMGIIPNVRLKQGLFRRPTYTLIVTADRIIAARVTGDMLRQAARQAGEGAKAAGRGIVGRFGATLGATMSFHQRYLSMDPDDALREHESNFAIATSDIRSVRARLHQMQEDGRQREDDLIFKTTAGAKYRFNAPAHSSGPATRVLRTVLGDRVR